MTPGTPQDGQSSSRVADRIHAAIMPYTLARAVRPILKATPEYEQALREKRSKAWLEAESVSLGYALAEVVRERLHSIGKRGTDTTALLKAERDIEALIVAGANLAEDQERACGSVGNPALDLWRSTVAQARESRRA